MDVSNFETQKREVTVVPPESWMTLNPKPQTFSRNSLNPVGPKASGDLPGRSASELTWVQVAEYTPPFWGLGATKMESAVFCVGIGV